VSVLVLRIEIDPRFEFGDDPLGDTILDRWEFFSFRARVASVSFSTSFVSCFLLLPDEPCDHHHDKRVIKATMLTEVALTTRMNNKR